MADGDRTGEVEVDVQVSKRVVASASTSRPSTPRRRFKRLIVACDGEMHAPISIPTPLLSSGLT